MISRSQAKTAVNDIIQSWQHRGLAHASYVAECILNNFAATFATDADNLKETLRGISQMKVTEGRRMKMWAEDGLSGFEKPIKSTLLEQANEILLLKKELRTVNEMYKNQKFNVYAAQQGPSPDASEKLDRHKQELQAAQDTLDKHKAYIGRLEADVVRLNRTIDHIRAENNAIVKDSEQRIRLTQHWYNMNANAIRRALAQQTAFDKWQTAVAAATKEYNAANQ